MKKTTILLTVLLTSTLALAQEFTLDDEALARLFVSEVSGVRRPDHRPIGYIINQRAHARGTSVAGDIAVHHYHHTQSVSRPYLAFLNRTMEYPAGWPGDEAHWEANGLPNWRDSLAAAHAINTGAMSHGCSEAPITWGGREVDCDRLQNYLRGNYHEVDCGNTANMFVARGHREPVPDLRCEELHARAYQQRMARRAARAQR